MTYKKEFPDFVLDVAIPAAWIDSSYKNDTCPKWRCGQYMIFVEYADPERRESQYRFLVAHDGLSLMETDHWHYVTALLGGPVMPDELALEFRIELQSWLDDSILHAIDVLNAGETNDNICHSHDYCDANQAMLNAMEFLQIDYDSQSMEQSYLINAAWIIAKNAEFAVPAIRKFESTWAATDWLAKRFENADNFRVCVGETPSQQDVDRYNAAIDDGCCGSFDADVLIDNVPAKIGCNFGH